MGYEMAAGMAPLQSQETRQRQQRVLRTRIDALCNMSARDVDAMLQQFVARGEIVFACVPDADNLEMVDGESTLDAEWDLSDEDAPPSDDSPDLDNRLLSEADYVIRVVRDARGRARCVPPGNAWAAARPVTPLAKGALEIVSMRLHTLREIASWLEGKADKLLAKGPEDFLNDWKPDSQIDFLASGVKLPSKGEFSKFISHARLAWPEGSIPLCGGVFNARRVRATTV